MRELRYLRAADDPQLVIVATADDGEQFGLRVTAELSAAVSTDRPPAAPAVAATSTTTTATAAGGDTVPSPREIQTRVRAGADPQQLADEHGVALERILRFAGAVVEERRRVADEARRGRAHRTSSESQTVVFGEAVDARFAAHGVDPGTVRWGSRRRADGQWLVTATWLGGEGEHSADWTFQLSTRQVAPVDATAADLLSDKPIHPVAPAGGTAQTPASPLAPGVVAFPAMPEAHTGPLPRLEQVFDQDAADPDAPRIRLAPAPPLPPPATVPSSRAYAPPLPLGIHDPVDSPVTGSDHGAAPVPQLTAAPHGGDDQAGAHPSRARQRERSKVPTWEDIMLGVRRKQD